MIPDSPTLAYTTRSSNRTSPLISPVEDPLQEAASMILSRIDSESYEKAVVFDTERILQRHVLPKSFVWNKPRIQLLRTLPRDIEDMPGILSAGGYSPFLRSSTNDGPFGYGMFDMGGLRRKDVKGAIGADTINMARSGSISRDNDSPMSPSDQTSDNDTSDEHEYPLKCSVDYEAAARRSHDPGIIELAVKLPPLSLDVALLNCQKHHILPRDPWLKHDSQSIQKAKMLISAERAQISSSMPLYWGKLDKASHFHPPTFLSDDEDVSENDALERAYQTSLDSVGVTISDKDALYEISKRRKKRKIKCTKRAQSCFRKWRLSVKVGSVSSRSSLLKGETQDFKPMHLVASFPLYFQTGKSVSIDAAQKLDEKSKLYLGSYDCRASAPHASMSFQAMHVIKKENRLKKHINIGRTRLIWSSFHQAGNNKIVCTSDLTGDKLDVAGSKRPLEAQVFVKLNGKLVTIQKTTSNPNGQMKWKEQDVVNGIRRTLDDKKDIVSDNKNMSPSNKNNAYCTLNTATYLKDLVKKLKPPVGSKKRKSNETYDKPMTSLGEIPPKIRCLPLDDGYIRVVCESPGRIYPSSVHEDLKAASQTPEGKVLCSVCWSSDETYKVLICLDCGLSVHEDCCADGGEYTNTTTTVPDSKGGLSPSWRCSICRLAPTIEIEKTQSSAILSNDVSGELLPSRKSRRTPRLPTRFTENTGESNTFHRQANTAQTSTNLNANVKKIRPSPQCILCPHSGKDVCVTYN